jgi:GNAT superfamily N-acetyltransferase
MSVIVTKQRKDKFLILELFLNNTEHSVAKLIGMYPVWDRTTMYICDLFTHADHRYKGYATQLLRRAIWEARRNGCFYIKTDDCSDGFGTEHNIYVNNGFVYEVDGLPEMRYVIKTFGRSV